MQFVYGEDGMAAERIENLKIPLLKMDNKEMAKKFKFFKDGSAVMRKAELKESVQESVVDDIDEQSFMEVCSQLDAELEQLKVDREDLRTYILPAGDEKIHLPVNIPRLLLTAKEAARRERFGLTTRNKTDLSPGYVIQAMKELVEEKIKVY